MKKQYPEKRFYYIEQYPSKISEDMELFTWKDACEIVKHCQNQHPQEQFVIREFEPI